MPVVRRKCSLRQPPACLDEQRAIDGLVRLLQILFARVDSLKPPAMYSGDD